MMRFKIAAFLSTVLAVILLSLLPCQASDANDLETILASAKPGESFANLPCLTVNKVMGKAVMYEGKMGDISIYVWVDNGIVDSLFLTVKGRLCPTWTVTATNNLAAASVDYTNNNGRILRYFNNDFEYYLVLLDKNEHKDLLTDLTVFRRGTGHEVNEIYHEDGDIWQAYFNPSQNQQ